MHISWQELGCGYEKFNYGKVLTNCKYIHPWQLDVSNKVWSLGRDCCPPFDWKHLKFVNVEIFLDLRFD